jgi:hypothetical protein
MHIYTGISNGKWKPRHFSLIGLQFAHHANRSLSFDRSLTKKQGKLSVCKWNEWTKRTKPTCPSIVFRYRNEKNYQTIKYWTINRPAMVISLTQWHPILNDIPESKTHLTIDGQVHLVHFVRLQMQNLHLLLCQQTDKRPISSLHNEQTVNGLRKIDWASVSCLKPLHIYIVLCSVYA